MFYRDAISSDIHYPEASREIQLRLGKKRGLFGGEWAYFGHACKQLLVLDAEKMTNTVRFGESLRRRPLCASLLERSISMPIYEYYCVKNHTVYQFLARSLSQGQITPRCPDNPRWPMRRVVSQFAFTGRAQELKETDADAPGDDSAADARMEAALGAMEKEFSSLDENDPRAMARMMRRMSELTGEKIDGEMEEVVRRLEEGVAPDVLEEKLGAGAGDPEGGEDDPYGESPSAAPANQAAIKEARMRYKLRRALSEPRRDPKLYDYE